MPDVSTVDYEIINNLFPVLYRVYEFILSTTFHRSFPWTHLYSFPARTSQNSAKDSCRSRAVSRELCPLKDSVLQILGTLASLNSVSISSTQSKIQTLFWFLSSYLCCRLETAPCSKLVQSRAFVSPSLRDHSPTLPVIHCMKTVFLCILSDFLVLGKRINTIPVSPSWLKAEI